MNDPGSAEKLDSQVLFETILDHLDGRGQESVAKAAGKMRMIAIDEYRGFTSLNFMLSDGRALYVYRDFQTNGQYYTLYVDNFGEMIVACSEPLLAMTAEPLPRGVLHTITSDLRVHHTTVG